MIDKKGWEKKTFNDVFSVITDGTHQTPTYTEDTVSGFKFLSSKDVVGGSINWSKIKYIPESLHNQLYARLAPQRNDILLAKNGTTGVCALVDTDDIFDIYVSLALLRPKKGFNVNYLVHFINSPSAKRQFNSHLKGVGVPNLHLSEIRKTKINIPPLPIQQQIVSELDTLSDIIRKKKQQLDGLVTLAQATFYDMFGDPVSNEKGLTVKSLGEICEITSSKRIYAEEYQHDGVPFYRSKEIIEKGKKKPISLELFISNERYFEIKNKFGIPEIGDILMTAVGTIGEIWVVDSNDPFYFKDGNIVWLKMDKSNNSTYFLFVLGLLVKEYKIKMSVGSAYSALTIVNLKNMKVVFPSLEIQTQFAKKIESIEEQKELINKSIDEVQQLFDYTMDRYFN